MSLIVLAALLATEQVAPARSSAIAADDARSGTTRDAVDAPAGASDPGDIVVTARRRAEDASRAPVSVIAFDADDLYRRSIIRAADLQAYTPGLQVGFTGTLAAPTLALRGQRRTSIGEGAPSVLIYENEVPLPTNGSLIPTFDVTSLQVLKGPQGTLFGRNATAGALLIYTAQPTGKLEGYGDVRIADRGTREVEGALNLPIIGDTLALRVAGQIARRDPLVRNLGSGPDLDDRHDDSFRVSLAFEPVEALRNVTVFDYYRGRSTGGAATIYGLYPNATAGGGNARLPALARFFDCNTSIDCDLDLQLARQQQIGPRRTFVTTPVFSRVDIRGLSNTTSWTLGDTTIKNIFGYRSAISAARSDADGTPIRLIESLSRADTEQLSDELQASGKLIADRLNWVIGGFYLNDRPNGVNSLALSVLSPGSAPPAIMTETYRRTRSRAVYGQIGYDLSALVPGVTLNAGIRRTADRQLLCAIATPTGQTPAGADGCRSRGQSIPARFRATTWTLGIDWQVTPDLFAYATSRRGYRAGGINSPRLGATLAALQFYAPETTTDVEVGLKFKGRVGDVPVRLSGDLYRGRYKGIQRNYTLPPNFDGDNNSANDPASGLVLNSGAAILQGAEFDLSIVPVRDLELSATGAYTDAHYKRVTVAPILASAGLVPANVLDNKFPMTPAWTWNIGASYTPGLGTIGRLLSRIDVYHSDRFWLNDRPKADVAVQARGYTLVNGRLGIAGVAGSRIDASLFATNLFNRRYVVGSGNFAPALTLVSAYFGQPRTIGGELRYRF